MLRQTGWPPCTKISTNPPQRHTRYSVKTVWLLGRQCFNSCTFLLPLNVFPSLKPFVWKICSPLRWGPPGHIIYGLSWGFWDILHLKITAIWNLRASDSILRMACFLDNPALLFWICLLILSIWNIKLIQIIYLGQGSANCSLQDKSCFLPGFVNEI